MSVLTLVRHGQASFMEADYDKLSVVGEQQVQKLAQFWLRHDIVFDRVFHGPARRHVRTAEIIAGTMQAAGRQWPAMQNFPEFDEFDAFTMLKVMLPVLAASDSETRRLHEKFESVRHTPEAGRHLQKLFEHVARLWCTGQYDASPIETWVAFNERIAKAIDQLRASAAPATNTVVFTSAGPIAATLTYALGIQPSKAIEFVWLSRNGSYSQFVFSGERFSMHAFNAIPHFDDLNLLTYR